MKIRLSPDDTRDSLDKAWRVFLMQIKSEPTLAEVQAINENREGERSGVGRGKKQDSLLRI
jgi:hypothetical protein